ncbi:UDP-glucuronosyltransferase 2B1-like [Conger conger]|uniref:UDP-glucuronosyltransferase 2B1-like n=1 Tax=Conger conger TaxID=82655 RepID=UPI002A599F26|nr:UDP-glucuronosyltransferase 2B1-like [Conger conger]XP_061077353.1 UDP-glucuronosyltransferase 2B1-like [Conger conger]XP_061077354.1 UDP-glucuronosyltransferase 2B1-like [Conger conger]XP_061077355.1 UDP-glucuronosyltransferase 2B1-like [Conger conger]XP_061077356.1 UDP-glucuronosyltransferase 2B1-like [Conger conger]
MTPFSIWSSVLGIVLSSPLIFTLCRGGNVLVYPIEGSHWVNMNILIEALHARGHNVTIVRSDKSWYIKEKSPHYSTVTVPVEESLDETFITEIITKGIDSQSGKYSMINILSFHVQLIESFSRAHRIVSKMVEAIFKDNMLTKRLQESQYDLVLADPCWGGGTLLAKYLNLPLVYNVRWLPVGEGHSAIAPSPLSYIPITGSGFSDKMSFTERIRNMLFYLFTLFHDVYIVRPHYAALCHDYLGPDVDFYSLMQAADLWLMRVDFVFEFPRPTMPNAVYIGGFQCKPAKPLPQDLEEFVQSSGEHGIIIMSLGTFVGQLPYDLTEEIAAAFAQLPQKIIWRHTGERPETLGNNTLLVKWMPQNDLLGHPKTRAFVAHGGTNGVQEAIYHGMPVLGIPLFFDQYDNLLRLKIRGGAQILEIGTLNKDSFLQALQEVLHEPSYRMNMQRLSRLHLDQPMKPLDRAMFWIEFVMRHKGAAHLRTESYRMPWYAYHSVDVIMLLLAAVFVILLTAVAIIRFLCCRTRKIKSD